VATRKNRPVLYEVVSRQRRAREPIFRVRPVGIDAPAEVSGAAPPNSPAAARPGRHPIDAATPAGGFAVGGRLRSFRVQDGRLHLSLGWPELTIAVVLALCLLVVAFQAGTHVGRDATSDAAGPPLPTNPGAAGIGEPPDAPVDEPGNDGDLLPQRQPRGHVAVPPARPGESSGASPKRSDAPSGKPEEASRPEFTPRPGLWYVIIQHFRRSEGDAAEKAATFLRSNGVACEIVHRASEHVLIASEPFNLGLKGAELDAVTQRLDQFKKRIKALGRTYSVTGGYSFAELKEQKF
jgi:hypothetical protein